uniref:MADF domain-containing protein n=1 Tax=Steinernema glaseri TaxID=37863 RepID=A0A1I7Y3L3_9BILA
MFVSEYTSLPYTDESGSSMLFITFVYAITFVTSSAHGVNYTAAERVYPRFNCPFNVNNTLSTHFTHEEESVLPVLIFVDDYRHPQLKQEAIRYVVDGIICYFSQRIYGFTVKMVEIDPSGQSRVVSIPSYKMRKVFQILNGRRTETGRAGITSTSEFNSDSANCIEQINATIDTLEKNADLRDWLTFSITAKFFLLFDETGSECYMGQWRRNGWIEHVTKVNSSHWDELFDICEPVTLYVLFSTHISLDSYRHSQRVADVYHRNKKRLHELHLSEEEGRIKRVTLREFQKINDDRQYSLENAKYIAAATITNGMCLVLCVLFTFLSNCFVCGMGCAQAERLAAVMTSLAWNYGQEACDLMIEEVGKYPAFYKLGLHSIERPKDLTGEVRESWQKVMDVMKEEYPEVEEESVWKAWRWIRRYYNTIKCPQKYAGKIDFLTKMRIEKQENKAYQKEAWKTSAVVLNKVSTAEMRKTIPILAKKDRIREERRSGLRPKNPQPLAQCGIRKNLTFDSTYAPKAFQPKKAAGIQGRGRLSVIDSFAVKYGEAACSLLFDQIGLYPAIYTPSCNIPDPKGLHDDARECWDTVMQRMTQEFPNMNPQDAWKAWRTLRRNYNNSSCPKNWVGKLPFLNELLATKDSSSTRPQKKRSEDPDYDDYDSEEEEDEDEEEDDQDRWSEKDEADKFADILSNLNSGNPYDENALLESASNGSLDEYSDAYEDTADEECLEPTPMELLLKNVEQANEREYKNEEEDMEEMCEEIPAPSNSFRAMKSSTTPSTVRVDHIIGSGNSRAALLNLKRKVPGRYVILTKKQKVQEPMSTAGNDAFKKLMREKWYELSDLGNPKAHLSLFKKEIMTVINKAFGDAGM